MTIFVKVLFLTAFVFAVLQTGKALECLSCVGALKENCVTLDNKIEPTYCSEYDDSYGLDTTCITFVIGLNVSDTYSFTTIGRGCGANYKNGTDYECPLLENVYKELGMELLSCETCDTDSCNDKIVDV